MRREGGKDGEDLTIYTTSVDSIKRPLFRHGMREPQPDGTWTSFAINYIYPVTGGSIEYETMETYVYIAPLPPEALPIRCKTVVREKPGLRVYLPLSLEHVGGPMDVMIMATLTELGYTISGGSDENPREPWAHFEITDPDGLERAFRGFRGVGRQLKDKGDPTKGTYLEKKLDPKVNPEKSTTLVRPFARDVNGREVSFIRSLALTIDYEPDTADGLPGRMVKATVWKNIWVEGDRTRRGGTWSES